MENEKSSVDILKDIAKRANWEFTKVEKSLNSRYGHSERNVIIRNHHIKGSYFISGHTIGFDNKRIFSGVFFPISGFDNYKLVMRKRDSLDKFSFRKNKLRFKIGNSSFDSKVHVETNNDIETHKLLSNSKIQIEIIEFLSLGNLLSIGFNDINPGYNKDLENKKYLYVIKSLDWMLDKDLIDSAHKLAELLRRKFN